jgi:DNA-binding transcriptional LysR family regulator
MQAVLPVGHPLAEKAFLEPADFHEQPFIANGPEISTRSEIDLFLAIANARPRNVVETQLSVSTCELVSKGVGVSIIEPATAVNFALADKVIARPLHPEFPFRYDLLLPASRQPSRVAQDFLNLVEMRIAELIGA